MRLVEEYRLFAAGARFRVESTSWKMNPRKDPSCENRPRAEFRTIGLAEDGPTEIELDRYRLGEPFNIEFGEHGFIVWSAASIRVAKKIGLGPGRAPTVLAPRLTELVFATVYAGRVLPSSSICRSRRCRAGRLPRSRMARRCSDCSTTIPVVEHAWSAAPAHTVCSPGRLI